jgi:hypothetical protein
VIMNSMQESQKEISLEIQDLKSLDNNHEELYSNIIAKLDELRNEIKAFSKIKKG